MMMTLLALAAAGASTTADPERICGFRDLVEGRPALTATDRSVVLDLVDRDGRPRPLAALDSSPDGPSRVGEVWCVAAVREGGSVRLVGAGLVSGTAR